MYSGGTGMSPEEIRGKILDVLMKKEKSTAKEIAYEIKTPLHDVEIELIGLEKIGLIVKEGKYYAFPEKFRKTENARQKYRDMIAIWYNY